MKGSPSIWQKQRQLLPLRREARPLSSGLGQKILVSILAVFTALVIHGLIIWISGGNPLEAYRGLLEGAFGSPRAISETLVWSTPYNLPGLAVALALRKAACSTSAQKDNLALGALAAALVGLWAAPSAGHHHPGHHSRADLLSWAERRSAQRWNMGRDFRLV